MHFRNMGEQMEHLAIVGGVMEDMLEVLDEKLLKSFIEPHRLPFTSKTVNA